jgi:tagatose-1,6-bisphosphate aldolase non-catalytic subunit AgaZ/GatZ
MVEIHTDMPYKKIYVLRRSNKAQIRRVFRYLDRVRYEWLNRINGLSILCGSIGEDLPPSQHYVNR